MKTESMETTTICRSVDPLECHADTVVFSAIPYVFGDIDVMSNQEKHSKCDKGLQNMTQCDITPLPSIDHHYSKTCDDQIQNMADATTQTDITMDDITHLRDQNSKMTDRLMDTTSLFRDLFVHKVLCSDVCVKFYTGLPSISILMGLFNVIMSSCPSIKYWSGSNSADEKSYQRRGRGKPGPLRKLSCLQEFILTLVRLRLGILEHFLGDLFGVSESRVSQIYTSWITLMSKIFGKLIKWPSRGQVTKHMPFSFKRSYNKTRAIIDYTEFFFQRPRSPTAQSATYSTYKSKNTSKCLLAISPSGTFKFVSDLYGGNVSDRFIFQHSGFLDLIEEGDDIMADRGFAVRDLLTQKKATLNMPPFTRRCSWGKNKRLNVSEIKTTREIAKLRIHVERAIQRLKLFRLLSGFIPWHLKPLMNQMVKVSAFFVTCCQN